MGAHIYFVRYAISVKDRENFEIESDACGGRYDVGDHGRHAIFGVMVAVYSSPVH